MIRNALNRLVNDRNGKWIRRIADDVIELIAPSRCIDCGLFAPNGWSCEACRGQVRWWDERWCPLCGIPTEHSHATYCPSNKSRASKQTTNRRNQSECRMSGEYAGVLRSACLALKKADGLWLADTLARDWWERHGDWAVRDGECFLVPIPRHWSRRWLEGHDPAYALAEALRRIWPKERSGKPAKVAPILKRTRATQRLAILDPIERSKAVESLFDLSKNDERKARSANRLILVDDICTTGATALSAAKRLRKAGARRIDLIAMARTLENRA